MRVLVACEYSGRVRDAFIAKGHDAMSCDLIDTEVPGNHYKGSVKDIIQHGWDLMVAHPPCTYLCSSGARWWNDHRKEQREAIDFVKLLMNAPIERICIENPIGILSTAIRKPDCIVQPYQFGIGETKKTCLWLKNLPPLMHEHIIIGDIVPRIHTMSPGPNRWKERSRTYQGIADAMANQWG